MIAVEPVQGEGGTVGFQIRGTSDNLDALVKVITLARIESDRSGGVGTAGVQGNTPAGDEVPIQVVCVGA